MNRVPLETHLKRVFLDELPKADAVRIRGPVGVRIAWGRIDRFSELLAEIDEDGVTLNRYGCPLDESATTGPSEDAIRTYAAVLALDEMRIAVANDWNPIEDIDDGDPLYQAAIVRGLNRISTLEGRDRVLTIRPSNLVRKHAILGGAPDTVFDRPERMVVRKSNMPAWFRRVLVPVGEKTDGETRYAETEIDGYDKRRMRPYPDAYRKFYYDPDPAEAVIMRAEYEVWRSALDVLADVLPGLLEDVTIEPTTRPRRPWIEGEPKGRRVLIDRVATRAAMIERQARIKEAMTRRRAAKRQAA